MRPIAPATQGQAEAAEAMIAALRTARDHARRAGTPRTLARILLALSSAEGAQRHVRHRLHRTAQDTALTSTTTGVRKECSR